MARMIIISQILLVRYLLSNYVITYPCVDIKIGFTMKILSTIYSKWQDLNTPKSNQINQLPNIIMLFRKIVIFVIFK